MSDGDAADDAARGRRRGVPRHGAAPRGHPAGGAGGARRASCGGASCRRARSCGARGTRPQAMLADRRRARLGLAAPARRSRRSRSPRWAGRGARRDPAARRRPALGHRARGRADAPALAQPRGLRGPGLAAPSDRVRAQAAHRRRRLRAAAPAARAPRGVARRRRRRSRGAVTGRARVLRAAGQRATCGGSRRSAPSTRSRSGAS